MTTYSSNSVNKFISSNLSTMGARGEGGVFLLKDDTALGIRINCFFSLLFPKNKCKTFADRAFHKAAPIL